MTSDLLDKKYYAIFTPESIERAKKYANIFQYGCHFLDDEDILDILTIQAEKIQERMEAGWNEAMDNIKRKFFGGVKKK